MNKIYKLIAMIFIGALLTSCGNVETTPTVTAASLPSETPVIPTVFVPLVINTPILSLAPTTETDPVLTGFRMAYFADGNIYLQNEADVPVQLTDEGSTLFPTFSDDGEKFVFLRGLVPRDLYSVDLDGGNQQILVSGGVLSAVGQEYNELSEIRSFAFVPDTHLIVFNTRQLGEEDVKNQDWNRTSSKNINDLLILDLDTGETSQLLHPGNGGNFVISPDGSLIAVQEDGRIDIVSIDDQIVYKKLVTYVPTRPYTLNPRMFWASDSTELIVTLPAREIADLSGPEAFNLWRYTIDGNGKTQIVLDPPILDADYDVSPDGNWILYHYFYYPGKTDESITSGLYLGDLQDGSSNSYVQGTYFPIWNPDSKHFVIDGPFLGSIEGSLLSMGYGRF